VYRKGCEPFAGGWIDESWCPPGAIRASPIVPIFTYASLRPSPRQDTGAFAGMSPWEGARRSTAKSRDRIADWLGVYGETIHQLAARKGLQELEEVVGCLDRGGAWG
jgi:hypothetical protein